MKYLTISMTNSKQLYVAGVCALVVCSVICIAVIVILVQEYMQCTKDQIIVYGPIVACVMNYTCSDRVYSLYNIKPCYADNYTLRVNQETCEQESCDDKKYGIIFGSIVIGVFGFGIIFLILLGLEYCMNKPSKPVRQKPGPVPVGQSAHPDTLYYINTSV